MDVWAFLLAAVIVFVLLIAFLVVFGWYTISGVCGLLVAGPLPVVALRVRAKRLRGAFPTAKG